MNQLEMQMLLCQQQLNLNSLEKEILITRKNLYAATEDSQRYIVQEQLLMLEQNKQALLDQQKIEIKVFEMQAHFKMNCPHCCFGLIDLPNGCIGECQHCHSTGQTPR